MNELSLFTGLGGGLLASELLGWRTVAAVEKSWYARCALVSRQNQGIVSAFPIWDDICTFDGRDFRGTADIVTGGFPCQAYSSAASGKNNADDLWSEMRRIVADVAPRYVFAENTSAKAIDAACDDLEAMGYKVKCAQISAQDMGADHIRKRFWLLAHAYGDSELSVQINAKMEGLSSFRCSVWESYANESGVAHGVAHRVDRLKAIGNGQVPHCMALAWITLCRGIEV